MRSNVLKLVIVAAAGAVALAMAFGRPDEAGTFQLVWEDGQGGTRPGGVNDMFKSKNACESQALAMKSVVGGSPWKWSCNKIATN